MRAHIVSTYGESILNGIAADSFVLQGESAADDATRGQQLYRTVSVAEAVNGGVDRWLGEAIWEELHAEIMSETAARPSCHGGGRTNSQDDLRFAHQCDLIQDKPQHFYQLKPSLISPSEWQAACAELRQMKSAASPTAQLQCLIEAASAIYTAIDEEHPRLPGEKPLVVAADEFTPIFIFVVTRCGLVDLCTHAEVLWQLTDQAALAGRKGYYLSQLSAALQFVLAMDTSAEEATADAEENSVWSLLPS